VEQTLSVDTSDWLGALLGVPDSAAKLLELLSIDASDIHLPLVDFSVVEDIWKKSIE
jgi:hypothetical protein